MRLALFAIVAAWTASISVSATPAVFTTTCRLVGKLCDEDSDCCSDVCVYKADCSSKFCYVDEEAPEQSKRLARRLEVDC
ncbi:hypothetical protein DEU56DRAFT_404556 [Suillus clintonianus]|uniref:uncharacterized protein n=1 Tax=Suillus clintonianus TaxID=1904413 RepID=UPI001B860A64|nr:uncharacterized protein DEU56DRAFT_404556 [Suillus clintonianus]KAG2134813.1 hypothetical protein DEU56DRAFT_404556 [Suillus clintonianus]